MTIKAGSIVSHSGALQWGAGKVLEVTSQKITIKFSDGISRKIAASHYSSLKPADAASYTPPPEHVPVAKTRPAARTAKRKK